MTISQMENVSRILLLLAVVFAIAAIVLFFVFKISKIFKISSKEYTKLTKQISTHIRFNDDKDSSLINKRDADDKVCEEENNCKYSGSEPTELILYDICTEHQETMQACATASEDRAETLLIEGASFSGSEPTQPLDNDEIMVLQDISYTNDSK